MDEPTSRAPSGALHAEPAPTPAPAAARVPPHQVREPPRPETDRLISGVLLKHGRAPYAFDPAGAPSYFVTLGSGGAERTLWGRGLERALVNARTQPRVGDLIGVRENGIDPMTVITRERDDRGHVQRQTRREEPRPHWVIERHQFFNERALAVKTLRDPRASRHEAVRNHPELSGAYWVLDSAQKLAASRIVDPPSRQQFVALVREALAMTVERGEALPVPIRRREAAAQKAAEATPPREDPRVR